MRSRLSAEAAPLSLPGLSRGSLRASEQSSLTTTLRRRGNVRVGARDVSRTLRGSAGLLQRGFGVCRSQEEDKTDLPFLKQPDFDDDVWSDERFNVVGFLFQNFIYVAILLTGLAGGLAAKSYNDGATFFLQKPSSGEESAKVISIDEVQRARNVQAPEVAD